MKVFIYMILALAFIGILFGWAKCCLVLLNFTETYNNLGMLLAIVGAMLVAGLLFGVANIAERISK